MTMCKSVQDFFAVVSGGDMTQIGHLLNGTSLAGCVPKQDDRESHTHIGRQSVISP